MSERIQRQFTPEFKLEAVRLVAGAGGPRRRSRGIWRFAPTCCGVGERAGLVPRDVFPGNGQIASPEGEIRRFRRELEVVREEVAFLK